MGEDRLARARRRLVEVDGSFPDLTEVRTRPSIWVQDGIVTDREAGVLLDLGARAERGELAVTPVHDGTGSSFEMEPGLDPVVGRLIARLEAVVGEADRVDPTLRFRRYRPHERHPAHLDHFEIDGQRLVATALVNLTDVAGGGATVFPLATPGAAVVPRARRLVLWFNHLDDGDADPLALHEGAIVRAGEKATVTLFVYGPARAPRRQRLTDRLGVPA